MNKNFEKYTNEMKLLKRNKINKSILSIFLFIAISVFLVKIIDGILMDYGFGIDKLIHENFINIQNANKNYKFIHDWSDPNIVNTFHKNFWSDPDIVFISKLTKMPGSYVPLGDKLNNWTFPSIHNMVSMHPNTFWLLTQFTWVTTIIVVLFLTFRLFKYESTVPSWLKWVMSQRTLSLVAMYDSIVAVGFWSAMFQSFQSSFTPGLEGLEFTITVVVHGVIPFAILIYSIIYLIIYLIKDQKASVLKEMFILRGIFYPTIYVLYYILVATIWNDPYRISNLRYDFTGHIWKLPVALLILWIMLGVMLLIHNFILLRFNKKYDSRNDYEVIRRRDHKIEKLRKKVTRKVERQYKDKK